MINLGIIYAVVIYLLIIIGITLYSKFKETTEDFLIASRKMGWFSLGLSIFASMISAYNIVISLTFAYFYGIYMMFVMLGVVLANIFLYFLLSEKIEFLKKNNIYSIVDYLRIKYGNKFALAINVVLLFVMFFFIVLQIKINALVFSQIIDWNINLTAIVICLIVLLYSFIGGFKTIVKTDIFQGLFMFFIVILAIIVGSKVDIISDVAKSFSNVSILNGVVPLMVLQFLIFMVQPDLWQRYISARNKHELKWGMIFSSVLIMIFVFIFVLLASGARLLKIDSDANNIFYDIISAVSPEWFLPILIVSLLAAFMSSLDSALFVSATQFASKRFDNIVNNSKKSLVYKIKGLLIVLLVLATGISLFLSDFLGAVFGLFAIVTVVSSVFLFAIVSNSSELELVIGVIVGVLTFLYSVFFGIITNEPFSSLIPAIITFVYMIIQKGVVRLITIFHIKP